MTVSTLNALHLPAWSDTSPLWGEHGENWSPQGRLTDWSFAGYHSGESPIPTPPVKSNVRTFGAKGDGVTDDTDAFLKAIEATNDGAILIPAGRYLLSDIIYIRKSNLVLRGEGPDKTTLVFSKSLEALKPLRQATTAGLATSGYSWSGGLIWVEGKAGETELGLVKTKALRGEHNIELATAPNLKVGQKIEIVQTDPGDNSLLDHLYTGQSDNVSKVKNTRTSFVSRVSAIDGATVTLERPLRTDIDPKWGATACVFERSVSEVGIENLGFEFPSGPYRGHFTEEGYNPLTFLNSTDCWARKLRVFNADSGPFVRGSFITVQGITFDADRVPDKNGNRGHHGFTLGTDTLLRDFDFKIKFVHDISAEMGAGSVAASGKGVDLCFDNHKRYPHANLFTDIDLGLGTRMYSSGGGDDLGRHSAAWSTWWNIRATQPQKYPRTDYGPDMLNFIGIASNEALIVAPKGRWFEPLLPQGLQPSNLYDAQLARRLGQKQVAVR